MNFPAVRHPPHTPHRGPALARPRDPTQPAQLIRPLFICPGEGVRKPISSMPGVFNLSIDEALKEAEAAAKLGIGGVLFFGLPESKDEEGSGAYRRRRHRPARAARLQSQLARYNSLVLIADVCLCEYTSHGHCGIVSARRRRHVGSLRHPERRHPRAPRPLRRLARPRRGRHRRAIRHDGWRASPLSAKPSTALLPISLATKDRAPRQRPHPLLRGQVRLRLLRTLPRGGRLRSPVWRSPLVPDGRGQPPRSYARDRAGPARRRRHDPDEAGPALPGHPPRRSRTLRRAPRRLPGLWRIRHAAGRLRQGLARARPRHPRVPARHSPRRRRLHRHLLRPARGQASRLSRDTASRCGDTVRRPESRPIATIE